MTNEDLKSSWVEWRICSKGPRSPKMWELKPQYSACKCQYLTRLTRFAPRLYSTQFLYLWKRSYDNNEKSLPSMQNKLNLLKSVQQRCYFHLLLLFTVHVKSISIVRPNSERACFLKCQSVNSAVGIRRRTKGRWGPSGAYSQSGVQGANYHTTINILMEIGPGQVLGLGRIWRTRMFSDIWKPMFSNAARPQPPGRF